MSKLRWFLGCLALSLISNTAYSLDILHSGERIELSGSIEKGDFRSFTKLVANKKVVPIHLNSPGGLVTEAIKIGEFIRLKGYETKIDSGSDCASACVLIFAGGIIRSASQTGRIGLHMSSGIFNDEIIEESKKLVDEFGENAIPIIVSHFEKQAGLITLMQVNYFLKMGVSLRLIKEATSVHHLDMNWLTRSEAVSFNIINSH